MSEDLKLLETFTEVSVEWKIKKFSSLPKGTNHRVQSPMFSICDEKWFLTVFPDGHTNTHSVGWVSLYLDRKSYSSEKHLVVYTISIRKHDGSTYKSLRNEYEFKENTGRGWNEFIKASELYDCKDIVSKDGSLTVFCKARINVPKKEGETTSKTYSSESVQILQRNFKDLYQSARQGDVTIRVKGEEFKAHSLILSARSPVFYCMFDHDTEEKKTGIVNIVDCDPVSFKDFLHFLYTGELDVVSSSNAVGLYKTADKYDLKDLKNACVRCMSEKLSVKSFCDVVILATMYNESELVKTVTDFFSDNIKVILPTPDWQSLVKEHFPVTNDLLIKMADKKL